MKCEKKGNLVNRQVTVGQEDLEQINRLTRREFSQEELYCFRVVLCDNDVDRQMERFDEETLEQLEQLVIDARFECTGLYAKLTTTEYVETLNKMLSLIRSIDEVNES